MDLWTRVKELKIDVEFKLNDACNWEPETVWNFLSKLHPEMEKTFPNGADGFAELEWDGDTAFQLTSDDLESLGFESSLARRVCQTLRELLEWQPEKGASDEMFKAVVKSRVPSEKRK